MTSTILFAAALLTAAYAIWLRAHDWGRPVAVSRPFTLALACLALYAVFKLGWPNLDDGPGHEIIDLLDDAALLGADVFLAAHIIRTWGYGRILWIAAAAAALAAYAVVAHVTFGPSDSPTGGIWPTTGWAVPYTYAGLIADASVHSAVAASAFWMCRPGIGTPRASLLPLVLLGSGGAVIGLVRLHILLGHAITALPEPSITAEVRPSMAVGTILYAMSAIVWHRASAKAARERDNASTGSPA
ncbi:hypothetical protein AB0N05_17015 [Nocardia sp. NPDC051030]|uniref:hypothetical protein n=1 Tax=Nocardia sp. NPDC051030 TaxID=3155162 RepID=UPI0034345558